MAIYELDPVDDIAVSAVGEPGKRRFFLLATGSGRTLTLGCEKSQIQALILRLRQMLEVQQIEAQQTEVQHIEAPETAAQPAPDGPTPGEPEWQIGEMGLGYHEARRLFVLVASEGAAGSEGGEPAGATKPEDAPSVRFWLSADQVIAFSKQAESVLSAGRPLCPRCGLPMDRAGHPCPVMNGARPIF